MKLEIKNLIKKYNDVRALDGFSVTMTQGVYGLLGPNGAGKSTLMNILTDNLKRDDGEILYDGREILEMGADYRKIVGYMPQEQVGYSQFSAYEFLRYMAVLKGLDIKKTETKEQIDTLLKSVHLYDYRKRKAGGFSGGMKRRLLLAQALLGKPEILILDEPTAGLDPKERIAMRNMIVDMAREKIIILATHIAADVECIADSVILIKKGKVIQNQAPSVLINEVRPYVKEILCSKEELGEYEKKYRIGNIIQRDEGLSLHIIDDVPDNEITEEMQLSLDDVYLHYFE